MSLWKALSLSLMLSVAGQAATLKDVLAQYQGVASALAKDDFTAAAAKARVLALAASDPALNTGGLAPHYKKAFAGANAMSLSKTADDFHKQMSVVSEGIVWLVKLTPTLQADWQLFKCPMVPNGAFGYWIQPVSETIANPYFGQEMLECGVKRAWAKFP